MEQLRIAIVGGGIGGLTAALTLARVGFAVTLFEQADEFTEAGAGLQLSPNASRVLIDLGLEQALRDVAFIPVATQFRGWRFGEVIDESPLGDDALRRYGAPYFHIHRGDLLNILLNAARQDANIRLQTGRMISRFDQNDEGVSLLLDTDTHADVETSFDVLVGADGIHSKIRQSLWGKQNAEFTGNVAWRALVPSKQLPSDLVKPMSTVWWGPGKHFVHYYVRGGEFVNCVCVVEQRGWQVESWTEPGELDMLRQAYHGWHSDLTHLIEQIPPDSLYKWALFDRPPMAKWGRGRVTLLGDACHPTLPFMAQGAAMAIEDAAVLSAALKAEDAVTGALQTYESLRKSRTAMIQAGSRRNATVFHLSGVPAWLRNRAAKYAGRRTVDKLYEYNPLNAVT
jgi:salicylate hydroxylase